MKDKFQKIMNSITENAEHRMNAMLAPEVCGYDKEKMTSTIRFEKKEWEQNQRGELHGGAVAAMFDTAMGVSVAAFSENDVTTADLSMSYIRPFRGQAFRFESEVIHLGRTLVRVSSKAYDEATGKCLASATSNFVRLK